MFLWMVTMENNMLQIAVVREMELLRVSKFQSLNQFNFKVRIFEEKRNISAYLRKDIKHYNCVLQWKLIVMKGSVLCLQNFE